MSGRDDDGDSEDANLYTVDSDGSDEKQTQAEVLDFVGYLLTKSERDQTQNEEEKWTRLSLASAMRGMEEETDLEYTEEDLEERFSAS